MQSHVRFVRIFCFGPGPVPSNHVKALGFSQPGRHEWIFRNDPAPSPDSSGISLYHPRASDRWKRVPVYFAVAISAIDGGHSKTVANNRGCA